MPRQSSNKNTLTLDVLQQFRVIFGTMRRHFREVEERCGLPGSQMWLLQEVQRCPGIGVSELAICLGIHQSTCSLLVDKLVARRFLKKTRKPSDRRCVGLALDEVTQYDQTDERLNKWLPQVLEEIAQL